MNNDDALAYGWMSIVLYLAGGILIWIFYGQLYDNILAIVINPYISSGSVSLQTAHATAWNVNIIRYCVPVILVFGFVFAINWAILKTGTGDVSFGIFWLGFVAFIIFTVGGLIMAFFGGYFIDTITSHATLEKIPMQDAPIATTMQQDIFWFINLYYFVCDMMPVMGAVIWGQSIVKRVRTGAYYYG